MVRPHLKDGRAKICENCQVWCLGQMASKKQRSPKERSSIPSLIVADQNTILRKKSSFLSMDVYPNCPTINQPNQVHQSNVQKQKLVDAASITKTSTKFAKTELFQRLERKIYLGMLAKLINLIDPHKGFVESLLRHSFLRPSTNHHYVCTSISL